MLVLKIFSKASPCSVVRPYNATLLRDKLHVYSNTYNKRATYNATFVRVTNFTNIFICRRVTNKKLSLNYCMNIYEYFQDFCNEAFVITYNPSKTTHQSISMTVLSYPLQICRVVARDLEGAKLDRQEFRHHLQHSSEPCLQPCPFCTIRDNSS